MITITGPGQQLSPNQEQPTIHLLDGVADYQTRVDKNLGGLGLEILQEGETPADATQSMLMSIAIADYQQYVFTEVSKGSRTNDTVGTLRSDFVSAQVPRGNGQSATKPAGATRSYIVVMVAAAINSVAVLAIVMLFIRNTKHTFLFGNG
ncbi:hypothetical protein E8E11_008282 [Didymella keratinophila]|nr:hypothetical protein E8E11_008282 [Didymella keratinophila]